MSCILCMVLSLQPRCFGRNTVKYGLRCLRTRTLEASAFMRHLRDDPLDVHELLDTQLLWQKVDVIEGAVKSDMPHVGA